MNDTSTLFLTLTMMALGGMGFYMYKTNQEQGDYHDHIIYENEYDLGPFHDDDDENDDNEHLRRHSDGFFAGLWSNDDDNDQIKEEHLKTRSKKKNTSRHKRINATTRRKQY
jgi:hypothetical protein